MSGESNLKAIASVVVGDSFGLNNIAIIMNTKTGQPFVAMPGYKTAEVVNGEHVYKDVFYPKTKELRNDLFQTILNQYQDMQGQEQVDATYYYDDKSKEPIDVSVRVTPYEKDGSNIKGLATVNISQADETLIVNNVKIMEGKDQLFVAMPSYRTNHIDDKGNHIYRDYCNPVTAEFREKLNGAVLEAYKGAKEQGKESVLNKLDEHKDTVAKNEKNQEYMENHEVEPKQHEQPQER